MGEIRKHPAVKYFTGITYRPESDPDGIEARLVEIFSDITMRSVDFDFSAFTRYYESEMGADLRKRFVVFANLDAVENLPDFKIRTNELEKHYLHETGRSVNLDPGYISEAKLVLATTKNYTHRLYLAKGIFGDVHLQFTGKKFQVQSWTYPDYQQPQVLEFFTEVRKSYFSQLNQLK
jgi:hypothetical protein